MVIYKITNLIDGKMYIGMTKFSAQHRWKNHMYQLKSGDDKPLYEAMRKYGVENFTLEEIVGSISEKELNDMEKYYIKKFNTRIPYGYNIAAGGKDNKADANPRARLTETDVYQIREIYNSKTLHCKECHEKFYKNRISFSAFQKI